MMQGFFVSVSPALPKPQGIPPPALDDPELFALIYTIDEGDDWTKPTALRKANPNFGISVDEDFLLSQQRQAMQSASKQTRFKTKHLNIWCSAKSAWLRYPVCVQLQRDRGGSGRSIHAPR